MGSPGPPGTRCTVGWRWSTVVWSSIVDECVGWPPVEERCDCGVEQCVQSWYGLEGAVPDTLPVSQELQPYTRPGGEVNM